MSSITNFVIIPQPVSIDISPEKFKLTGETLICSDQNFIDLSEYLKSIFSPSTGFKLSIFDFISAPSSQKSINLIQLDGINNLGPEGYILEIKPSKIEIKGNSPAGVFYGIQTLRQLLPIEIESNTIVNNINWEIPCVKIEDYPRFSWRGYMLDEARHFHGKDVVKKLLNLLAFFKMNYFHWHLTDDQGWRIDIKKYPKLTEIGSKREETQLGGRLSKKRDGIPHSGYYTQEDIQEIIRYAENRFIKIIPEINMPGHTRAALASYPNLSCKGFPFKVSTRWGVHKDILCVGKEEVFDFAQDILTEIANLFPFNIIHIGGDEVLDKRWQKCPKCQSRINVEGLKDEKELQVYFTNRLYKFLTSIGQKIICWNDALKDNVNRKIICQFWLHGKKKVYNHLKKGGNVINSNFRYTYLDLSYPFIPLKRAYKFDPIPKLLRKKYHKNILGLEAPMWGELIPTINRLEWQTFPRLIAFAETGWSPKQRKNYSSFQIRLKAFLKRLDILGVNYARENKYKPRLTKRMFGFLKIRENQDENI
ncbi:MAG: beta-N-acetylhexosaminidase [Promethearchaeota archaeon]